MKGVFNNRRLVSWLLALMLLSSAALSHNDMDVVSLVRDTRDSVVSVRGVSRQPQQRGGQGVFPFDFFFPFPDQLPRSAPRQRPAPASIGSGFIIDADGYVLTNAHVVRNLSEIVVTLSDDSEYPATVVGMDRLTDIAVLKIEPDADKPLQVIEIGDSDALMVGQSVLAIGSPYGLDQTVTKGIISALGRQLPRENYVPFIQTDAAVNPGNSGGPLINGEGRVIGINSQIISPVRAFAGVSFAIPINVAMDIQERLREDGTVRRGYLGISFRPVTEDDVAPFGLNEARGALVQEVIKGSAADMAGMKSGDILTAFNGEKIENAAALPRMVTRMKPGSEVEVELLREGETLALTVVLGEIQDDGRPAALLGMRLENLTAAAKRNAGLENGVRITAIEESENTPADVARQLRAGDIITHVFVRGRLSVVPDLKYLENQIKNLSSGDAVAFRVWRGGRRLIITIKLGN